MNPEFTRNLWLEMTTRRVALMVVLLALLFFAAALTGGEWAPSEVALVLYYVIVVVWGTRSAALAVVGEIRDRTWDGQRLSSLGAGMMMWGKLFGATVYNWFGGVICLVFVLAAVLERHGAVTAVIELCYFIGIGVIAQAAALLASLVAVARRHNHSRFGMFVYQLAGLAAALAVFRVWEVADPVTSVLEHVAVIDTIPWWGTAVDARVFLLVSLAIFSAWTLAGCYREMRRELKLRNGPLVWLAFLLFMGVYVAGFDAWLSPKMTAWDAVGLRLLLAGTAFGILTYLMVLLEPKDRVHYRWMLAQLRGGRIGGLLAGAQAWMMSYGATFAVAAALSLWLLRDPLAAREGQPLIVAAMGFVTRDVALFVLLQTASTRRRGDVAALTVLFALYVLVPYILAALKADSVLFLFYPQRQAPGWIGAGAAWAEALVVLAVTLTRLGLPMREAEAPIVQSAR
ncbi:MAG: hypothetical protein WDM91_22030 [Rhizomicrobium sp.]